MTRTFTLSLDSFWRVSVRTSAEPPTSALRMIGNSLTSPAFICLWSCSRVMRLDLASSGVVKLDNMELAVMLGWYQVTSTPAQLALVAARSLRDAVAVAKVYSVYDQET